MSNLFDYSVTPASNNSAAPNGAPEGMAPSGANDVMRQIMANAAAAFTCYTAGGSANAQTVTMSPTLAAYSNKVRIAFIPVAANTGAFTVNVNSLGAVAVKMQDGSDPPAGVINSSGIAVIQHNGTNFVLLNVVDFADRVELGNGFTAGEEVTITRTGNTVTITSDGALAHGSASAVSSTANVIPAAFRPSAQIGNVYYLEAVAEFGGAGLLCRVHVTSDGTLQTKYTDFAGGAVSRTDTYVSFSLSYNIENNIT